MRLNPNDFTEKALKALQDAQTMLASSGSNLMKPEHLLYSVLEQDDEYVNETFEAEDLDNILADLDNAISDDIGMRYSGPQGGLYLSNNLARALEIKIKSKQDIFDGKCFGNFSREEFNGFQNFK
jgi:ATP-dependent Clp protease ATP-binding subunit ClpC